MDVEAVLDSLGVEYREEGKRFMVQCPFHDDRNPSCGVWKDSGYFKCFGCGEEGSMADFVAEVEDIPIHQALRRLREGDSVSAVEREIERVLDVREKPLKYYKLSSFHSAFPPVQPETRAWDYLSGRGLTEESIHRFDVRWGGDTGKYRYRVVLPIRTVGGKLLSYVGRTVLKDTEPKTKKSRSPHRTFFGLYELLETYGEVELLIVVEGEFDAIYLQQFGLPVVANMGTSAMGPEKIRLLRKYARRVVLSYDGDAAGHAAMYGDEKRRGQLSVLKRHLPTVAVPLPDGRDPNTLSEDEVEEMYGEWKIYV